MAANVASRGNDKKVCLMKCRAETVQCQVVPLHTVALPLFCSHRLGRDQCQGAGNNNMKVSDRNQEDLGGTWSERLANRIDAISQRDIADDVVRDCNLHIVAQWANWESPVGGYRRNHCD